MRSRSNSLENVSEVNSSQLQTQAQQSKSKCDEPSTSFQGSTQSGEPPENMSTVQQKLKSSCCSQAHNKNSVLTEQTTSLRNSRDLSHDDLLLLLSILEGELQARDEVITVLRADKIDLALLEAHYGFVTPHNVLQALQRDNIQGKDNGWHEDIYEKPIAELDKLAEKQRETYRRMLEQLLLVEQAHKQTLYRLEDEKRNHSEYMKKSDEFTNLLEQERERLKLLSDQEKAHQEHREEENKRKVTNLNDELIKLKAFAFLIIDEQQHVTDQLAKQTVKVQDLQAAARKTQEELISAQTRAQEMESKLLHLEAELHDQTVQFHQEQEAMSAKLSDENNQNRHLHQTLSTLCQELEESNEALHKAEEELQELRNRISNGENGNPCLVSEVEELRKRVIEMEGKDKEFVKIEALCRDLKRKLEKELMQNYNLKIEVDKLSHRIMELEKFEEAFGKCNHECNSLKSNLEKESTVTKHMFNDLEILRVRIKELEAVEGLLEKTEWTLTEDLTKLKTLTVMLVNERKTMADKLKQLENKVQNSTEKLQAEQEKVISVTEKLIEENKKALKFKMEMEEKICIATKERDDLKNKLKNEEDKNNVLQSKISVMMKRLQSLESIEREFLRNKANQENMKGSMQNDFHEEDNKVKELTQKAKWLWKKLSEIHIVEDELEKTHNDGELLEERYSNEKALMEELEIAREELSKSQPYDKEKLNQEHILYKQLQEEEVKSSCLTKEVEELKEKIHNYMGTEESILNIKTKYAIVQRKLTQQELRNKGLAREIETITRELERYRHFSKSLRPGMIGRRFSDLQVSTKEVQTEPTDSFTTTYKNLALLEQTMLNGKINEESNHTYEPNYNEINPAKCSPSLKKSNNHDNKAKQISNYPLKNIEEQHHTNCKVQSTPNGSQIHQGDMLDTHNPSQLVHTKVTPDQSHNMATLETSRTTGNTQTYTTNAVIPTRVCSTKQQINAPVSPHNNKSCLSIDCSSTPEQSNKHRPFIMTHSQTVIPDFRSLPISDSAVSPNKITTITTGVPDREQETEVKICHTMFCVPPQTQNNCYVHRYNSSSPSGITNEDNKIHIRLGIPYLQTVHSNAELLSPSYSPGQEERTSILNSYTPTKVNNKTVSNIRIKPTSNPTAITN